MRFLDLAVAVLIGVSSLGILGVCTPQHAERTSAVADVRMRIDYGILGAVRRVGIVTLASSGVQYACARISSESNGTMSFSAVVDGHQCQPVPPAGAIVDSLNLTLPGRHLVIEGW